MRLEYFQMIDRITALDTEGRTIRAECRVPEESPIFEGHFPGYPILPGVLMIETMAQAGGWLVISLIRFAQVAFLAQVKVAKMRAFVSPGEALVAEARLEHDGSGYAVAATRLLRDGKLVGEAEITYRLMDFPNEHFREQMLEVARRVQVPPEFMPEPAHV